MGKPDTLTKDAVLVLLAISLWLLGVVVLPWAGMSPYLLPEYTPELFAYHAVYVLLHIGILLLVLWQIVHLFRFWSSDPASLKANFIRIAFYGYVLFSVVLSLYLIFYAPTFLLSI